MKRLLIAIVLVFGLAGSVWGEEIYFVDNSGCGDCADYDPVTRTCGSGLYQNYDEPTEVPTNEDLNLGDIVYIREGTYAAAQITLLGVDSGSIWMPYNDESVILNAKGGNAVFYADSSIVTIRKFTLNGPSSSGVIRIIAHGGDVTDGEVSECLIAAGVKGIELYAYGGRTLSGIEIFNSVIDTEGSISSTYGIHIIYGDKTGGSTSGIVHTIYIHDNTIDTPSGRGVVCTPGDGVHTVANGWEAYGIELARNTYINTPNTSIQMFGVSDNGGANPCIIHHETISASGYGETISVNAIRLGSTYGVKIFKNDISGCLSSGSGDANGIILDHWEIGLGTLTGQWRFTNGSTTVTEIGDGSGDALNELNRGTKVRASASSVWYTVASVTDGDNFELTENFAEANVDDTSASTVCVEWNENAEIYTNNIHDISDGNGYGIQFFRSKNSRANTNVIDTVKGGIEINSAANEGTGLLNNTIYNTAGHGILLNNGAPQAVIKNNIIRTTGYDGIYKHAGAVAPDEGYDCFSDITESNCDGFAEANAVISDPLFVNPENGDFHLKAGSPCIDAGTDSPYSSAVTDLDGIAVTDASGNALGAGIEIGAYNMRETYNIGPGETYTTFSLLVAAVTLTGDDIVDGGGNTFEEPWVIDGSGSIGHPITLQNATCWEIVGGGHDYITVEDMIVYGNIQVSGDNWIVDQVKVGGGKSLVFSTTDQTTPAFTIAQATGTRLWAFGDGTINTTTSPGAQDFGSSGVRYHSLTCSNNWADVTSLVLTPYTGGAFNLHQVKDFGMTGSLYLRDTSVSGDIADLPTGLTGNLSLYNTSIFGDIADLPTGLTGTLSLYNTSVSGNIANLPAGLTGNLILADTSVSGDITDLPAGLAGTLSLYNTSVSGDIADLPTGLIGDLSLRDTSVSGDIADLPTGLTGNLHMYNTFVSDYSAASWPCNTGNNKTIDLDDLTGLDETEVSNILCHLDTKGITGGTLDLTGTTAPNAAGLTCKTNLEGKGWTVSVTP